MINSGSIEAMLLGFAMGNAWISPLDSVLNCAAFLHFMVSDFVFEIIFYTLRNNVLFKDMCANLSIKT